MMIELQVGDVIRCPGYPGVQKPARFTVVAAGTPCDADSLTYALNHASRAFKKYGVPHKAFGGSFWAIERNGTQIWPLPTVEQGETL